MASLAGESGVGGPLIWPKPPESKLIGGWPNLAGCEIISQRPIKPEVPFLDEAMQVREIASDSAFDTRSSFKSSCVPERYVWITVLKC